MYNVTLKDLRILLAITPGGVTLDQLTHLIPDYKDAFDSQHKDALGSLFRLELSGLTYCTKIHVDDWSASPIDVKLADKGLKTVLEDNWYQYRFFLTGQGVQCLKNMREQAQETLFGAPKETVVVVPEVKRNEVNIVSRLQHDPVVIKEPVEPVVKFNPDPFSMSNEIIQMVRSWTEVLERDGLEFNNTQFSKAYSSYEELFEVLIGTSYSKQDIARAVYLMEDVVDMENDLEIWLNAGVDVLNILRKYTPSEIHISEEWADHITFMTIPESTSESVNQVLHHMCLRFQEIENGDYKSRNKWHGLETTDENKYTEDELLVDELETLIINGHNLLANILNFAAHMDPRKGQTKIRTAAELYHMQGFHKKEHQLTIEAAQALSKLEETFTLDQYNEICTIENAYHKQYALDKMVDYGFLTVDTTDESAIKYTKQHLGDSHG